MKKSLLEIYALAVCVFLISFAALLTHSNVILLKKGGILFGLYLTGIILVSLSIACLVEYVFVGRKFHDITVEYPRKKWVFVITFLPIFLSLLIVMVIFARNNG